ncbi:MULTISPECIES: MgtC/SapB family protein [Oceanobacillus]|uniref:Protein SapB n=1 Tax=Oceanobacillus indicireducens TaxID=1004261 RepID=A0A918D2P2_9BACI|nr:MgtC/SapB family protein [Oceanobacillus indicireducens]GGN59847.1 protein SapB [Oceanobacillus indicireducens]
MDIQSSLLRLVLAALLGLIIGLERELKNKPLGIKTCIVICVSSSLLTVISIEAAIEYGQSSHFMRTDPMRLAAQIVSGIGFIGAGVILKRGDNIISGITTAAIIWGAAGLGISVGAGFYWESIVGAVIILFGVDILPYLIKKLGPVRYKTQSIRVSISTSENAVFHEVIRQLGLQNVIVKKVKIKDLDDGESLLQLRLDILKNISPNDIYSLIHDISNVNKIEVETV